MSFDNQIQSAIRIINKRVGSKFISDDYEFEKIPDTSTFDLLLKNINHSVIVDDDIFDIIIKSLSYCGLDVLDIYFTDFENFQVIMRDL